jgi:hypothetical protein
VYDEFDWLCPYCNVGFFDEEVEIDEWDDSELCPDCLCELEPYYDD